MVTLTLELAAISPVTDRLELNVPVVPLIVPPLKLALIVVGSFNETAAEPFTLTAAPVLVPSVIVMFLAVPQFVVVILEAPLKLVPLIFTAVANLVVVAEFPEQEVAVPALVA